MTPDVEEGLCERALGLWNADFAGMSFADLMKSGVPFYAIECAIGEREAAAASSMGMKSLFGGEGLPDGPVTSDYVVGLAKAVAGLAEFFVFERETPGNRETELAHEATRLYDGHTKYVPASKRMPVEDWWADSGGCASDHPWRVGGWAEPFNPKVVYGGVDHGVSVTPGAPLSLLSEQETVGQFIEFFRRLKYWLCQYKLVDVTSVCGCKGEYHGRMYQRYADRGYSRVTTDSDGETLRDEEKDDTENTVDAWSVTAEDYAERSIYRDDRPAIRARYRVDRRSGEQSETHRSRSYDERDETYVSGGWDRTSRYYQNESFLEIELTAPKTLVIRNPGLLPGVPKFPATPTFIEVKGPLETQSFPSVHVPDDNEWHDGGDYGIDRYSTTAVDVIATQFGRTGYREWDGVSESFPFLHDKLLGVTRAPCPSSGETKGLSASGLETTKWTYGRLGTVAPVTEVSTKSGCHELEDLDYRKTYRPAVTWADNRLKFEYSADIPWAGFPTLPSVLPDVSEVEVSVPVPAQPVLPSFTHGAFSLGPNGSPGPSGHALECNWDIWDGRAQQILIDYSISFVFK